MERVTLHTDLPELTNDLCDVIRLFLGECEITQEPGGSLTVAHTMGQEHVVTVGDARAVAALTPVGADELENKRLCKRAVKNIKIEVYPSLNTLRCDHTARLSAVQSVIDLPDNAAAV